MSAAGDRVREALETSYDGFAEYVEAAEISTLRHEALASLARLEAVAEAARTYRQLVSPQYEGEEWEAAQELDAALRALDEEPGG